MLARPQGDIIVRVSLLHYNTNTVQEVNGILIENLA